jgi:hypothetical protein
VQTFDTSDFVEARRCRRAQFTGQISTVQVSRAAMTGLVHSVEEDPFTSPAQWTIKIFSERSAQIQTVKATVDIAWSVVAVLACAQQACTRALARQIAGQLKGFSELGAYFSASSIISRRWSGSVILKNALSNLKVSSAARFSVMPLDTRCRSNWFG